MKRKTKSLILLPLLALCLASCEELAALEDLLGSEDVSSDSYEDSEEPEIEDETESETDSDTGSEPKEDVITYSLEITNKSEFEAGITNSYDNPNTYNYSLNVSLYTYTNGDITSTTTLDSDSLISTSSNPSIVDVSGTSLILGTSSGEVTISTSYKEDTTLCDSVTFYYSYTEHIEEISYKYDLVILDKEDIGSTWKITDAKQQVDHTLTVKLYEYKYIDNNLADGYPTVKDATLSDIDITFSDQTILGVSTESISFYPKAVGSTSITLTWIDHPEALDSIEIIVEEVTYEYGYALEITNADNLSSLDESPWRVGEASRTLEVSLTSYTYVGSLDTSSENYITGTDSNVSLSIVDSDGNPTSGLTATGLTLTPLSAGSYFVTATWIGHEEATQTIQVDIREKVGTSYSMNVLTDAINNMEAGWYVEDEASRSFSFDISPDDGEGVDLPYSDNDIKLYYSPSELQIDYTVSGGVVTITPLGIDTNQTVDVYVYWTVHTEAHVSFTLSLNQHAYGIEITNASALSESWTIYDEARTAEVALTKDNVLYEQSAYVKLVVGGDNPTAISINGLTITPVGEGSATVSAIWYKYDPDDPTYTDNNVVYATSDAVVLSIDDDLKPASINLSKTEITFNAYTDSQELSATVLGSTGKEATEQGVTWSVNNDAVVIEGEGNTITIGVSQYNVTATITCTSAIDTSVSATCSVSIGDQPNPNGPQAGDPTYKLGCKSGDTYYFFNGTTSSSHLQTTEDWEQAVDVYVTPNEYEIGGNGCTLSFYDSNNTLEYIASSESSSSKGNMKLTTTPYRWVWDSYNDYSFFSAPAFEGRYIGLSTSDFRTYATSSLSSNTPVYPYSDVPADYGQEPEPEPGDDDDDEEGLLGKLDFTLSSVSTGSSASASDIDNCWSGDSTIYSGCTSVSTIYLGNNSTSGAVSGSGFIRASSGSVNGQLGLKFALGVGIDQVVIKAESWTDSEGSSISVNGSASQSVSTGSYGDLIFDITGDYVNSITIAFTKRSFVQSIKIYGTYNTDVKPIESLSLSADTTSLSVGDSEDISVSWAPIDTIYDLNDLTWESSEPSVASVTPTSTGATVNALGAGTTTIKATTSYGVSGSIEFNVNSVSAGTEITTQVTYQSIMDHEVYAGTTWSSSQTVISSANGKTTDFLGCSITWYTGSGSTNGCSIYNKSSLRIYYGAYYEISALDGYEITGVQINLTSNDDTYLSISNASKTRTSTGVYDVTAPVDSSLPITVKNSKTSSNTHTYADAGIIIYLVTI